MSIVALAENIGKPGTITVDAWLVQVKIIDARSRYGTIDYLVKQTYDAHTAVTKWVRADRVVIEPNAPKFNCDKD
jgi:hypothetical protein